MESQSFSFLINKVPFSAKLITSTDANGKTCFEDYQLYSSLTSRFSITRFVILYQKDGQYVTLGAGMFTDGMSTNLIIRSRLPALFVTLIGASRVPSIKIIEYGGNSGQTFAELLKAERARSSWIGASSFALFCHEQEEPLMSHNELVRKSISDIVQLLHEVLVRVLL